MVDKVESCFFDIFSFVYKNIPIGCYKRIKYILKGILNCGFWSKNQLSATWALS